MNHAKLFAYSGKHDKINFMRKDYILITPAYNEEEFLEKTIKSVVSQTHLPKRWVIVSDGSMDRTDEIASNYARKYEFINFIRIESNLNPQFGIAARKVAAIKEGFRQMDGINYEFYGNLDADITFGNDFYESLIRKFESNEKLGLGGAFVDNYFSDKNIIEYLNNPEVVGGCTQLFRRKCYEEIGGYRPVAWEDSLAVLMTRMNGWEAESFPDIRAYHHKCAGLPGRGLVRANFHIGRMEHIMGDHPVYELARCAGTFYKKPFLISSISRMSGYIWSMLKGNAVQIPLDVMAFNRKSQIKRLKKALGFNR